MTDNLPGEYPDYGKKVFIWKGRLRTAWLAYEDGEKEGWLIDGEKEVRWKRKIA